MTGSVLMPVSEEEAELLAMLRGIASRNFYVSVRSLYGVWNVKLATAAGGAVRETTGRNFAEAWSGISVPASAAPRRFEVIERGRV